MRVYSISFREYDEPFNRTSVSKTVDGRKEKIKTDKHGNIIVPEFDIQKYESFGGGFDHVKYVGELDNRYFLGVSNIEIERAIDKIKNKPDGLNAVDHSILIFLLSAIETTPSKAVDLLALASQRQASVAFQKVIQDLHGFTANEKMIVEKSKQLRNELRQ
jgi:hypothetical protein